MKNLYYLSKLNLKGKNGKTLVVFLITLLIISFTLIPCFTITMNNGINVYKTTYMARSLSLVPVDNRLNEKGKKDILSVDHVKSVDDVTGFQGAYLANDFSIVNIDDKNLSKQYNIDNNQLTLTSTYSSDDEKILAGKSLEDSPEYSCILPSYFDPFGSADFVDASQFVGKTITLNPFDNNIEFDYNAYEGDSTLAPSIKTKTFKYKEIKLKVVGVYKYVPNGMGEPNEIYISRKTELAITKDIIEKSGIDLNSKTNEIAKWWNDSTLHNYLVVCDNYDNTDSVFEKVYAKGYGISDKPNQFIDDSTILISNLFSSVGTVFTIAIIAFAIFILFQSTINSIKDRKGTIGLMKAIGYKNKHIFISMCFEQLKLTLIGFIIGGIISLITITITNNIFTHGYYSTMMYIVDWDLFGTFLLIALGIVIIIPILCQLVLLGKLAKIQPQEAMINE